MNLTSDQKNLQISSIANIVHRFNMRTSFLVEFYDWLCPGSIQASYKVLSVCIYGLYIIFLV